MDFYMALVFSSKQHLLGVLNREDYFQRIKDLLEEVASSRDADAILRQFAQNMTKGM